MDSSFSILLAGAGKMGGALLERWQGKFPKTRFHVIDPQAAKAAYFKSLDALPSNCHPDVIVFAVKPQQLEEVLPSYKKRFGNKPLYISIAAGKTTRFFKKYLGDDIRIVRAMPNTPALVGKGMTALCAPVPSGADKKMAEQLMEAVGSILWVDESQMDAVTALSGSGPAYVFLFLDALVSAGVAAGLSDYMAKTLAVETVMGSCALASESSESFEQLRKNVTSPGGTTEAALKVLMEGDALEKLIEKAVQAAAKRSKELSN